MKTFVLPIDKPYTIAQHFNTPWVFDRSVTHKAVDYMRPPGSAVYPCAPGTVYRRAFDSKYGNFTEVDHGRDTYNGQSVTVRSLYAHFVRPGHFAPGTAVDMTKVIGDVGSTGYSTDPHVHFELRVYYDNGTWAKIDPEKQSFISREDWKAKQSKPTITNNPFFMKVPSNHKLVYTKDGAKAAVYWVIKTHDTGPRETRHAVLKDKVAVVQAFGGAGKLSELSESYVNGLTQKEDYDFNNVVLTHPEYFMK